MTRRGRDRCRGLRGSFGYPNAAMGRPGPSDSSLDHPVPILSSATLSAARKPAPHASRISEGAGRARLACGNQGGASTPGQSDSGPLFHFCTSLVRGVGWAHASIRPKPPLLSVSLRAPPGRWPNHRARRLLALREASMPSASITVRKTKGGRRRYAVRFRLGDRAYPVEHGGSFSTMREARSITSVWTRTTPVTPA
jgi:hypothetical protein